MTLLAVSLGTFMLLLDVTIIVVALPDIQHELGAGFSQIRVKIPKCASLGRAAARARNLIPSLGQSDTWPTRHRVNENNGTPGKPRQ